MRHMNDQVCPAECSLSTEEGRKLFADSLKKIDQIHQAVHGLPEQPSTGFIHRIGELERFRQDAEKTKQIQLGIVFGAAASGGGLGALITKLLG